MNLRTRPAPRPGPVSEWKRPESLLRSSKRKPGRSSAPGRRRAASASAACSRGRALRGLHLFRRRALRGLRPGDVRPCPTGPRGTLPPGPPAERCAYSADKKSRHALFRRSDAACREKAEIKPGPSRLLDMRVRRPQEKRRGYGKGATIVTGEGRPQGRGRGFASAVMPRASLPRACHECCGRARAFSRSAARRSVSSVRDSTPRRIFRSTSR